MKYKIGDRVRIKSLEWYEKNKEEDGFVYTQLYWFSMYMIPYCGREAVIVGIYDDYYRLDIDNNYWMWTDNMLEDTTKRTKEEQIK